METCVRCRYDVLGLMFKFAVGRIEIGRVAPEKPGNAVCVPKFRTHVTARDRGTADPQRLCQNRLAGLRNHQQGAKELQVPHNAGILLSPARNTHRTPSLFLFFRKRRVCRAPIPVGAACAIEADFVPRTDLPRGIRSRRCISSATTTATPARHTRVGLSAHWSLKTATSLRRNRTSTLSHQKWSPWIRAGREVARRARRVRDMCLRRRGIISLSVRGHTCTSLLSASGE